MKSTKKRKRKPRFDPYTDRAPAITGAYGLRYPKKKKNAKSGPPFELRTKVVFSFTQKKETGTPIGPQSPRVPQSPNKVPKTYLIPLDLVDAPAVAEGPVHRCPRRLDAEPPCSSTTILLYPCERSSLAVPDAVLTI